MGMPKKLCFTFIALLYFLPMVAQNSITGIVTDSARVPVPFAAVALLKTADSSIVKGSLTDANGKFVFDTLTAGHYLLKVADIGYAVQYSNIITVDGTQPHKKVALVLRSHGTMLGVINVAADKPFVEHKVDRSVYNIGSDDLMSGRNGAEVLQNLPGIMAPDNGDISVAGKTGTMILIDGRPTYLAGQDISEYLKSIDASQIERVEVITSPSSKYDAAGGAVINIVLKKDAKIGFHGNLTLVDRQAYYNSQYASANGNYRTKQWNIYGTTGVNTSHSYGNSEISRDFEAMTPEQLFNESSRSSNLGENYSGRLGADYMPDNNNTIGISANTYYSTYSGYNNNYTSVYNQSVYADSSTYTKGLSNSVNRHSSAYLDYTYKIDSTGKEFSASAGYNTLTNSPIQQNTIYYYDSTNDYLRLPAYFSIETPITINTASAQADCTLPFHNGSKFEAGIKAISQETDNNSQYWNNEQGIEILDTTRSNHFDFTENIFSGYGRYLGKLSKKINYSLGVRVENTEDKGIQHVSDSGFTRNYTNVFPNANINWNADSNNTFYIYYREGINRPNYSQLNPFLAYATPYSYYTGNINLQPSFYYNYGLSYSYKSLLGVTFEYSHTNNVIQSIWEENNNTHISYYLPMNIATGNSYFLFLNSYVHVAKWWTMMNYCNIYYSEFNGSVGGTNYGSAGVTWYVYSNNTFTITRQWKGEMNFSYNSASIYGFVTNQAWYNMNAAISKKIAKDRGVIKAGGMNLITPSSYASTQMIQNATVHSSSYWYPQTVYVSLSWKLGKIKPS